MYVDAFATICAVVTSDASAADHCVKHFFIKSSDPLACLEFQNFFVTRMKFLTLYPQKLALTSPTSGGRSVGIVR
jgi:hypothetical protein